MDVSITQFHSRLLEAYDNARKRTRWSKAALAADIGIAATTLNRWLSGDTRSMDVLALARLFRLAGQSLDEALGLPQSAAGHNEQPSEPMYTAQQVEHLMLAVARISSGADWEEPASLSGGQGDISSAHSGDGKEDKLMLGRALGKLNSLLGRQEEKSGGG